MIGECVALSGKSGVRTIEQSGIVEPHSVTWTGRPSAELHKNIIGIRLLGAGERTREMASIPKPKPDA